jgi:hypothetical protein
MVEQAGTLSARVCLARQDYFCKSAQISLSLSLSHTHTHVPTHTHTHEQSKTQGSLTEGEGLSTVDLLIPTSLDQLLFRLKRFFCIFTKQANLTRRSVVLSLPRLLVFPARPIAELWKVQNVTAWLDALLSRHKTWDKKDSNSKKKLDFEKNNKIQSFLLHFSYYLQQGRLTEGEGLVQLT